MKISIDRGECTSCGLCWSDCPDVFEESPHDGLSSIVGRLRLHGNPALGEAPESLREAAQAAADGCPVSVIHVE